MKHDPAGHKGGDSRNGQTTKTLKGGEMKETPRDRKATFDPQIVCRTVRLGAVSMKQ